jgi:hypothetical protein
MNKLLLQEKLQKKKQQLQAQRPLEAEETSSFFPFSLDK